MDKNQFIGVILMVALLAVYFTWFTTEPTVPEETANQEETAATSTDSSYTLGDEAKDMVPSDSLIAAEKFTKYGIFAFAAAGEESERTVENENLRITFTNKGGRIKEVVLKDHLDYSGSPFKLMDASKSQINAIIDHRGKAIRLNDLNYSFIKNEVRDTLKVIYVLSEGSFSIQHVYSIPKEGFQIGLKIQSDNLNSILNPTAVIFEWNHAVNRAEKTLEDSRRNANVRYYLANDTYGELSETSEDFEEETLTSQINWVSFKQKFFSTAIIPEKPFQSGYINQKVDFSDSSSIKYMSMNLAIPYSDFIDGLNIKYYFGTNKYNVLKKVAPEFEENLDIGWGPLPIVNKFLIIPIFNLLQGVMSNYGLIIIIIVVIVRLILSPLTYKSHMSMAKMKAMKPELDELKEKYGEDMQKMQQEQMSLYRQVGINPLSGCIPLLLQMPILFSLFFFFPNAVEFRGESFLWAHDLSTYDSVLNLPFQIPFYGDHVSLFTLLMTLSTIATIWSNSQVSASLQGPMKTFQYLMPITMLFFLNNYASGLTFYYFISNMVTFGQTVLFRKLIDEDKIHRVLQENKKKNAGKKKSKFQQRLEDAMKANQEAQRSKKRKK